MALFHYRNTVTVGNQNHLLRCKTSKWHKNYYFQIIVKTKCNILSIFAFKNYENFTHHNLEKLCPWPWPRPFLSLVSRGSILKKSIFGLDLGLELFSESLAWKAVSWTPTLVICTDE